MTWASTVRSHQAWVTWKTSSDALGEPDLPDDADIRDAVDRARWLLAHVKTRFDRADPREVSAPALDALNSQFAQIPSLLANLQTSPGYVPHMHQWCDTTVGVVASWPNPRANANVETVGRAATEYQTGIEKVLAEHVQLVEKSSNQVEDTKATFAAETASMTASVQVLQNRVEVQASRLDQGMDALSTRFDDAEAARAAGAESAAAKREADFALERQRAATAVEAELASLEEMRGKARATLQAIGVDATASHYGTYADQQRTAAFRWSFFTVILGVLGAVGVLWALHGASISETSWQLISLKSISSTVLLGVAGYAGAQAAGHRREERRSQRIELGLAALDPFLANVDGEDVKTLRLALGAELFAAPPGKDHDRSLSPLQAFQQSLTTRAITARLEATAGTRETAPGSPARP